MGFPQIAARTFGLIALGVVSVGAAYGGARVQIPFDCHFDGVRVHLEPSRDRSYEIIGRRDREIFSACSPVNPDRCRSWFVHRFDLDCNGARVAWLDVAAAASRYTRRRAWVEDGRFHMRMGPMWIIGRDRPPFPPRGRLRGPYPPRGEMDGFGADGERPYRSSRIVTLPPGYAPALGIPMSFSGVDGRPASEPLPSSTPNAARVRQPAREQTPVLPMRADRKQTPPTETVAAAKPNDESARKSTGSVTPAIINAQHPSTNGPSASGPPATQTTATSSKAPVADDADPSGKRLSMISSRSTPAISAALRSAEAPDPTPSSTTVPGVAAVAFTVLALAGLAAFGVWRSRRSHTGAAQVASRDIGSISLDGAAKTTALVLDHAPNAGSPPAHQVRSRTGEESEVSVELPMPTILGEALDVLGASPDASKTAIKKIVDGLRQSWHPDLAKSKADRVNREQRLRQINVAWDLISQRNAA